MRSPEARAKLAEKHPRDLDDPLDEDVEQLWVEEAARRDVEIDSRSASVRDAGDVFRDARSRLAEIRISLLEFAEF